MKRQLKSLDDLNVSGDPRMPQADITNAQELFGDPFGDVDYGDMEDGDADGDYGDVDYGDTEDGDLYGDVINDDSLGAYNIISGDPSSSRRARLVKGAKVAGAVAAGGLATAFAVRAAKKAMARRRAAKARMNAKLSVQRHRQTLEQQRIARQAAGKIARNQKMPFFQVTGAKMNSSPIDSMEGFVADMFAYNLNRQASDTPFFQESALGIFAAGIWTCTATGVVANRFYTGLILQVGINYLNAAPGTIFQVTATLPTINGTLTVSSQPWIFTIMKQYDVRFLFFPWQLVANRPFPVIGQYSNANPIVVQVSGLPSASAVSLVVPGSLHPWTVAMRNSLMQ